MAQLRFAACLSQVQCAVRQGSDVPVDEYSPAAFAKMVSDGEVPAEVMPLVRPLVLDEFTKLPDSMQTKVYDIHTTGRFPYPCTYPDRTLFLPLLRSSLACPSVCQAPVTAMIGAKAIGGGA
jgi:hypothetical protein